MCATFSEADIGKPVERTDGKVIGTVGELEDGAARIEPAPDVVDTIKARFGWAEIGDPFVLSEDAVHEITDTRVHLEEGFSRADTRLDTERERERPQADR